MNRHNNDGFQKVFKRAKRVGITILCCIPILVIFAYLTRNVITSSVLQVVCFMIIMGIAVAIVEIVASKREKTKEAKKLLEKDVFK